MKKLNKKAGEEIISVWLFIIWALIAVGIIVGVLVFYSTDVDIREGEAKILGFKIANCLKENDFMESGFDIFSECKINKELIENSEMYYINILIDGNQFLSSGVVNYENLCKLQDKSEDFPRCYENVFYIHKDKIYEVKILTASNQIGSKI